MMKTSKEKKTETLLGQGIVFEKAYVKGNGTMRIDGSFSGVVDIEGHIILGETGDFLGTVRADSALFAGKYQGEMLIRETLHLTATSEVSGQIEAGQLIVDEGATFDGTFNVSKNPTAAYEETEKKEAAQKQSEKQNVSNQKNAPQKAASQQGPVS